MQNSAPTLTNPPQLESRAGVLPAENKDLSRDSLGLERRDGKGGSVREHEDQGQRVGSEE